MLAVGDESRRDDADVWGDVVDAWVGAGDEQLGLDEFLDGDDNTGLGLDGNGGAGVLSCFRCVFDLSRVEEGGRVEGVRQSTERSS